MTVMSAGLRCAHYHSRDRDLSLPHVLAAFVRFVSVDRFLPADVVARLSGQFNFIHVGDYVSDDMGELVSVLSACDHAISVDNSTAHLAGALGLPMSLMLTDGA